MYPAQPSGDSATIPPELLEDLLSAVCENERMMILSKKIEAFLLIFVIVIFMLSGCEKKNAQEKGCFHEVVVTDGNYAPYAMKVIDIEQNAEIQFLNVFDKEFIQKLYKITLNEADQKAPEHLDETFKIEVYANAKSLTEEFYIRKESSWGYIYRNAMRATDTNIILESSEKQSYIYLEANNDYKKIFEILNALEESKITDAGKKSNKFFIITLLGADEPEQYYIPKNNSAIYTVLEKYTFENIVLL